MARFHVWVVTAENLNFISVVENHRYVVLAHCYRMTGSLADAEDIVQETWVRAWRAFPQFTVGSDDVDLAVRAWLLKIATNRCLTFLKATHRRAVPFSAVTDQTGSEPPAWIQPLPTASKDSLTGPDPAARVITQESVQLAFLVAIHRLPPRQRAALLLRDVLGFAPSEVATTLGVSTAAANSILQRARAKLPAERTVASEPTPEHLATAERYAEAWEAGDISGVVAMLADDARYSMPPIPQWFEGPVAIEEFLRNGPFRYRWRFIATEANGSPAFGTYSWNGQVYAPMGLDVLTIESGMVTEVVSFLDADLTRFGLPSALRKLPGDR